MIHPTFAFNNVFSDRHFEFNSKFEFCQHFCASGTCISKERSLLKDCMNDPKLEHICSHLHAEVSSETVIFTKELIKNLHDMSQEFMNEFVEEVFLDHTTSILTQLKRN